MATTKLISILEDHGVPYAVNKQGQAFCIDEHNKEVCLSDFNKDQLFDWLGY